MSIEERVEALEKALTESRIERVGGDRVSIFGYQTPAAINQAAPVQNQWYPILGASLCRAYGVAINVEDANETLQMRITVDGQVSTPVNIVATHSTTYFIRKILDAITRVVTYDGSSTLPLQAFLFEGKNIYVEVRKTTATGAGNLTGIVQYGVLEDV